MVKLKVKKCMREFISTKRGIRRNKRYKDLRDVELCVLRKEKNKGLHLFNVTDKKKIRETGYKYLISSAYASSHTAFRTKRGLDSWLKTTGLKRGKTGGWKNLFNLKGTYNRVSLAGNAKLLDKFGKENMLKSTAVLSNGEYTRGYVEKGKRGNTIYYLNPNYQRKVLKYRRP